MAGALGDKYLVKIGDTSVSPSAYTTVKCQGDLTFNTGKTLEISRTKDCKNPFFREAGFTVNFTSELETPMDQTQTDIITGALDETQLDVQVISSEAGLPKWEGVAYVTFDPLTAPTEGIATIQVTLAFVDDPVYGTS